MGIGHIEFVGKSKQLPVSQERTQYIIVHAVGSSRRKEKGHSIES